MDIQKIEFDKIISLTSFLTLSDLGKDILATAKPFVDSQELKVELERVQEIATLLRQKDYLPIEEFPDTRQSYRKCAIDGNWLEPKEFLEIAGSLKTAILLKKYFYNRKEKFPAITLLVDNIWFEKKIQYEVAQKIDDFAQIKPSASNLLFDIHQSLQDKRSQLQRKYESLERKYHSTNMLMDEGVAIRNGRMVLGFRVEHKYEISGFIHDFSQSGRTVFIEPSETLHVQNEIRDLEIQKQKEEIRILKDMTAMLQEQLPYLLQNQFILSHFDSLYAKAQFALQIDGTMPEISEKNILHIINAYHPLLLLQKKKEAVSITLELGKENFCLVLTGPNAGGKSVTLKTVGLLSYMLQCGFLVPCDAHSIFSMHDEFFIEIGDAQSIESDLSTFSSHLKNLKHILQTATSKSLILIDEICSGTSPEEGSAIASAMLVSFVKRKSITIVTTHQSSLKNFAHETEGIMNGSMQFDTEHFLPTYQLVMGVPGASFAIEMMKRLQFSHSIITDAEAHLGSGSKDMEQLLINLSQTIQSYNEKNNSFILKETDLQKTKEQYQLLLFDVKEKKRIVATKSMSEFTLLFGKTENELKKLMTNAKQTSKNSLEELKKIQINIANEKEKILEQYRTDEKYANEIKLGDVVRMMDSKTTGKVIEMEEGKASVQFDNFKMKLPVAQLTIVSTNGNKKSEIKSDVRHTISANVSNQTISLDIRGLYPSDAMVSLQIFVDNSYINAVPSFMIIHGKGTGALSKKVVEFLKDDERVQSFRFGDMHEGGAGVTIVEMK